MLSSRHCFLIHHNLISASWSGYYTIFSYLNASRSCLLPATSNRNRHVNSISSSVIHFFTCCLFNTLCDRLLVKDIFDLLEFFWPTSKEEALLIIYAISNSTLKIQCSSKEIVRICSRVIQLLELSMYSSHESSHWTLKVHFVK